ncbi:PhzF family phenazine biosynthesis protein [Kitasatospora acidiphila]|uniref:PhzF family phenazine biosynthesis protein n=1 Tax=Kitasatospora acidiphila TaxID=2567942 RepID=A0A540VYL0_9ACTN|nr:PhzF family phenazine biosynthesis isomerase [Kitasatospora acidiphila]TQF01833.1 PhzF family phenazine biosynthesis protein [Kitasatospora acidiphila]
MRSTRRPASPVAVTLVDACVRDDGRGGSPTAVLGEDATFSDEQRRRIPGLVGTSHAVFVATAADVTSLRFFTAEGELPACGHGTVAALAYNAGTTRRNRTLRTAGSHSIPAWTHPRDLLVAAEFEAGRVALREPSSAELAQVLAALGLAPEASGACVATLGRPRLLLPVPGRAQLSALTPDFTALEAACRQLGLLGCYLYTGGEQRFAARMFAPAIGVPEDIANANSTACLAAWLHAGTADCRSIAVDMGDQLGSPATITATVADTPEVGEPVVHVGGLARVRRTVLLDLPA